MSEVQEWLEAGTVADRIWEDMKYGRCAPSLRESLLDYEEKHRWDRL